jgi:hypothetical protein
MRVWITDVPAEVDPSTPVVTRGLGEGKWLNRLLGTCEWQPAGISVLDLVREALRVPPAGTVRIVVANGSGETDGEAELRPAP